MLWIPLSAGQRLRAWGGEERVDHVLLNPRRRDESGALHREVRAALWPLHHLAPQEEDAIQIDTVTSFTAPIEAIGLALHVLLGFVGTVTLLMSAVGVANLMIAVASERRCEFAMRRACGARRSDVALQLLVETGVVVLGAGLLGVAFGVGAVELLRLVPLPSDLPHPRVAGSVLVTTFLVLTAVGLVAGVAPARRAAQVDPSAALRAL